MVDRVIQSLELEETAAEEAGEGQSNANPGVLHDNAG
ncbi:hypothetical protein A2U01_0090784, partial [Trifolium medium]|nr:hypothetical protein [Trifolium medium]